MLDKFTEIMAEIEIMKQFQLKIAPIGNIVKVHGISFTRNNDFLILGLFLDLMASNLSKYITKTSIPNKKN